MGKNLEIYRNFETRLEDLFAFSAASTTTGFLELSDDVLQAYCSGIHRSICELKNDFQALYEVHMQEE